jgi:hypothetical protein
MYRLILPALIVLAIAAVAFGAMRSLPSHQADAATNVVTNGTFDSDVAGWAVADGNINLVFNGAAGDPTGAVEVQIITYPAVTSSIEQCVPISADTQYGAQAFARMPTEAPQEPSTTAAVRIDFFSDGACTTSVGAPVVGSNWVPDDEWVPWADVFQTPANGASALLQLTVTGFSICVTDSLVYFDNVSLQTSSATATATLSATATQGAFRTHTPTSTATAAPTGTPTPAPTVEPTVNAPAFTVTSIDPTGGVGAGGIRPPETGSGPGIYGPHGPLGQFVPNIC